jgi:hypothetical protein
MWQSHQVQKYSQGLQVPYRVLQSSDLSDQRDDKVIQQKFQGQGYCNTCCGTDKDADKYDDKLYLMGSCHIFQKSFGSLDGVLI